MFTNQAKPGEHASYGRGPLAPHTDGTYLPRPPCVPTAQCAEFGTSGISLNLNRIVIAGE